MRILHVLPSLKQSYGGPIRAVLDLSSRAEAYGLQSEVLGCGAVSMPDNPLGSDLLHSVPLGFPSGYCYSPQLRPWLRANLHRFNGVVIHGMWLYPGWATAQECTRAGVPYACFPHGMLERWAVFGQGIWKALKKTAYWQLRERAIIRGSRCVFFTTRREQDLARLTFGLNSVQAILAPYGVDSAPVPTSEPTNPEFLQPEGRKVVLFLGRLHPKKNADMLIEAWTKAQLPADWHLVIAGSGRLDYANRLKQMVARNGVSGNVHFLGFVAGRDKTYLFQRAEWFVLPSFQENFGLTVLEAITNGCPVAISDQVFISEALHDKSEVIPLKPEAWVDFMRTRMIDDAWRQETVRLDRELLVPKMAIEHIAKSWADTLTQVFSTEPSRLQDALAPTLLRAND
ncbi:MAG: glycosyltransferase [Fimbriimonadaceae bacterium]